jgi:uncharacterized membrane protein
MIWYSLSVKVWALAHLLANGRLADLMLFGAFLVWSVLVFRASRQRDRLLDEVVPESAETVEVASPTTTKVMVIGALALIATIWAVTA